MEAKGTRRDTGRACILLCICQAAAAGPSHTESSLLLRLLHLHLFRLLSTPSRALASPPRCTPRRTTCIPVSIIPAALFVCTCKCTGYCVCRCHTTTADDAFRGVPTRGVERQPFADSNSKLPCSLQSRRTTCLSNPCSSSRMEVPRKLNLAISGGREKDEKTELGRTKILAMHQNLSISKSRYRRKVYR